MQNKNYNFLHWLAAIAFLLIGSDIQAFQKPVNVPAQETTLASTTPMNAVDRAGERMVAVGQRGIIIHSDDNGETWIQSDVPVSNDLTGVSFASKTHGWAVGHGGVILHSVDGGLSWDLQIEGHETSDVVYAFYEEKVKDGSLRDAELYSDREAFLREYGGTQSLMDVYFVDENHGFAVGIFNRLLSTEDGGQTWRPWAHRIDNPMELHLYSINGGPDGLYITGEQGMVWRYSKETESFEARETGYGGTLFGSASQGDMVIAFGMRGSVFRSENGGNDWTAVELGTASGITDGVMVGDGTVVLTDLSGNLHVSKDGGESFSSKPVTGRMPFYGIVHAGEREIALVGEGGARKATVEAEIVESKAKEKIVSRSTVATTNNN